jgi:hypothetical protein
MNTKRSGLNISSLAPRDALVSRLAWVQGRTLRGVAVITFASVMVLSSAKIASAATLVVTPGLSECIWYFDAADRSMYHEIRAWVPGALSDSMTVTPKWTATFQYSSNGSTWSEYAKLSRTGTVVLNSQGYGYGTNFGYAPLVVRIGLSPTGTMFFWRILTRIEWLGTSLASPASPTQGLLDRQRITNIDHYQYSFRTHVLDRYSDTTCIA